MNLRTERIAPLGYMPAFARLTPQEKRDLVAFLRIL